MSNIIKGSITEGYDLKLSDVKKLHAAGIIAEPTLNALKNYFVKNILVPELQKLKEKYVKTGSPNEISGLRKYIGDITIAGNPVDLKQLNTNFKRLKSGEITQSQILDTVNPARRAAALGFSPKSRQTADLWNEIARLRQERHEAIQFATADEQKAINKEFDKDMKRLFKENRNILPRVNNKPIEYKFEDLDKYGWREGRDEKGYLQWQKDVYRNSQDQTRAIAQELGFKFDAGHSLSLGGISITPEEMKQLPADIQRRIKSEGSRDPDNKNNWILRGTNASSNLSIELAKSNRSKGKSAVRDIQNLVELNIAFDKPSSLVEYNLQDDKTFRKNEEYDRLTRNMLTNSSEDINAIIAKAENKLINEGPTNTPISPISQTKVSGGLPNVNPDAGDITTTKHSKFGGGTGGIISQRTDPDTSLTSEQISKINSGQKISNQLTGRAKNEAWKLEEQYAQNINSTEQVAADANKGIKTVENIAVSGFEHSVNAAGTKIGQPSLGSNIVNVVKTSKGVINRNLGETVSGASGFLTQTSIEPLRPLNRARASITGN